MKISFTMVVRKKLEIKTDKRIHNTSNKNLWNTLGAL